MEVELSKLVLAIPTGVPNFLDYLQTPLSAEGVVSTVVPYPYEHYINSTALQ